MYHAEDWNPKQKLLGSIITDAGRLEEAVGLALELHAFVHASESDNFGSKTLEDELWEGLDRKAFITMPTPKDVTIAWNLWHITRIEDLTVNILIADARQVFDDWQAKLKVEVKDTGNAMNDDEILALSAALDMTELRNYRRAVGVRTREVLLGLKPGDMKAKVKKERLNRILEEGGVLEAEGSKWLLDFWGKKNIAGLIMMPVTRHQVVHLNDSFKLKKKCRK
ncbi:MAG: DinB family protein [Thermoclostridium sp.]|nr:DinB family protein [Thermoclostridium sp.]